MAQIIDGGADAFNALVYSSPHPGTLQFLANQAQAVTHRLTEAGRTFIQNVKSVYDRVDYDAVARLARAVNRKVASLWQNDEIRALVTMGQLQHAPIAMQRYVMAEPQLRKLYHAQGCDGYSDTYVDTQPGRIGIHHYDYRRATNGLFLDHQDEDVGVEATTYFEDLLPDDRDLMHDEQVDIQTSWAFVRDALKRKKDDPTSVYNASL